MKMAAFGYVCQQAALLHSKCTLQVRLQGFCSDRGKDATHGDTQVMACSEIVVRSVGRIF